jgi:hypothetical protein
VNHALQRRLTRYAVRGDHPMGNELCSPKMIHSILAEVFDRPLTEAGFKKVRDRVYVRSRIHHINDFVEFWRDRLDLNFLWGLSLDFVPHITTGVENVRWHRTPKSTYRDFSYSGFGRKPQLGWSVHTTEGEDELRRSALVTRSQMMPKAMKFFGSIEKFHDLETIFQEQKIPNEYGFTFEMKTQVSLAYSFYLAKSGQERKARQYMSRWLVRNSTVYREETVARISELFENAVRSPYVLQ